MPRHIRELFYGKFESSLEKSARNKNNGYKTPTCAYVLLFNKKINTRSHWLAYGFYNRRCLLGTLLSSERKSISMEAQAVAANTTSPLSKYRGPFAQFMTMREKQILARDFEIQKENWG